MQSTKYERVDGDNMSPTNGVSPTSGEQWNSIPFTVSFAQQYMYVAPGSKLHSVRNGMVVNLVAFVLHEKLCDPVLGALLVSLLTSLPKFDGSVWDTPWCQVGVVHELTFTTGIDRETIEELLLAKSSKLAAAIVRAPPRDPVVENAQHEPHCS